MVNQKQATLTDTADLRQNEGLWDVGDVAAYLNVSRSSVRRRVEASEIPYVRIGNLLRFDPDTIREWVKQQHSEGKSAA